VGVGRLGQPNTHDLGAGDRDPFVDRVYQLFPDGGPRFLFGRSGHGFRVWVADLRSLRRRRGDDRGTRGQFVRVGREFRDHCAGLLAERSRLKARPVPGWCSGRLAIDPSLCISPVGQHVGGRPVSARSVRHRCHVLLDGRVVR